MAKSSTRRRGTRAPRVKLAGTVLLLARLESGRQQIGKLHQLSVTGGLVQVENPLDEGIKVEVIFHVGKSTVRTKARILFPMWATKGYLQPFEFVDLANDDRILLETELKDFFRPTPISAQKTDELISERESVELAEFSALPTPAPSPSSE